jgi:hypothetical protein
MLSSDRGKHMGIKLKTQGYKKKTQFSSKGEKRGYNG